MTKTSNFDDIRNLYDRFDAPITTLDCGKKCAPFNPSGKPFCCDICQAVPVAYQQEWGYLQTHTDLWHEYRGDECAQDPLNPETVNAETPAHLTLLACKGPALCQRDYRAISCRQFPFFPYITSDFRFIGLTYYPEFESSCWVISNLDKVTAAYRNEFISTFDEIFNTNMDDFDSYLSLSEETRAFYTARKRRFHILHRNGLIYLVSPISEQLTRMQPKHFRQFSLYT